MLIRSKSSKETEKAGENLGKKLKERQNNGSLLCLYGDLGAGKTTFVRGLAKALGIKSRIQSPTFTISREHRGAKKLYHFDCYRITKQDPLLASELAETISKNDGVIAIEWAQNIENFLPKSRTNIHFEYIDVNIRKISF